jgi:hypothetical protein
MDVVYEVLCMYLLGATAKLIETNICFLKPVIPGRTNRIKLDGQTALWLFAVF